MSIRHLLTFSKAWSSEGASTTFPAVVASEADARENLDYEHIAAKNKINEILAAIVSHDLTPKPADDDEHIPTTAYMGDRLTAIRNAIVNPDWNVTDPTSKAYILHKPDLAPVATSGSYEDLTDTPAPITVDASVSPTSENPVQSKGVYNAILSMVYPVGSIYMSVSSTSPATFLGGTWERIKDRFLLAAGDDYSAGATGGEATHTLTASEMPAHKHTFTTRNNATNGSETGYPPNTNNYGETTTTQNTSEVGGGAAHNNMPPYLAVYMWRRTA